MNDLEAADPNIQTAILDVLSEGLSAAILLYDKNDLIVFSSQQFPGLLPVPKSLLMPGARMRDLLAAMYDAGIRLATESFAYRRGLGREDWIAEQIAGLWKERYETIERPSRDRWLNVVKRRLSSGYGICVVKDVSEQKKREEQWRLDTQRVQVTEEVLDKLPFPISDKDRNSIFVAVNKANCDFLDLPAEDILGLTGADINPTALEERLGPINQQVYDTGVPVQIPERVTRPDGSTAVVVVHKYRIGKPGRYYLVTVKQDLSRLVGDAGDQRLVPLLRSEELVDTDLSRGPARRAEKAQPAVRPDLTQANVLVATSSPGVEAKAVGILTELGADVSAVASADELALFLQLASEADIGVDLVVIDRPMPAECGAVADAHGISAIRVGEHELEGELPSLLAKALSDAREELVPSLSGDLVLPVRTEGRDVDILVAEDNEVNQIVFSQIIESFGYRYALATDGEEAVRLWRECSPRLVLMDITLPKLNGLEACAAIRALEGEGAHVPVVGVLTQAFDRDREGCLAAGMDDVIMKPISPESLESLFSRFIATLEDDAQTRGGQAL